ncbi:MAG TPA: hypothetical protein PKH79_09085 [Prolixibacteraceae bacterium]|nr:hypothetical protein [Prolixibacteraceae bacterium]HPS11718.1 hypothetical protein [Prolixibacteraceae bacterium]
MKTQILFVILFTLFTIRSFAQADSIKADFKTVPIQFTLLTPPFSTNGIYFYNTINDVSLNTFIGVGAATNYLELGGFININRLYANGLQLSGFANINGFDRKASSFRSEGVQLSGFANFNGNDYTGVQGSGFINTNRDFEGIQASGFLNLNRNVKNSLQVAGFANINKQTDKSFQAAGFANLSTQGSTRFQASGFLNTAAEINGIQASGFANLSKNLTGVQGSGFMNLARDVKGLQGSGFANVAHDVEGLQASGFINIAHKVKGVQAAGFINICDSIDGIPIGFISIVKKGGYRNFEVSTSEWSPVQLTYRMGIEKFYSIYTLSKLDGDWDRYALGFGFGHNHNIFNKTDLNIELVHHEEFLIRPHAFGQERENSISQLKLGIRRNLFKNIWINAGPTFNMAWAYRFKGSVQPEGEDLQPYLWNVDAKVNSHYPNWNSRFWVGFHAGISIN